MKILGIETSCDETGVCLIEATGTFEKDFHYGILGNALYSQVAIHAPYGGVFPNLAKREHAKNLIPLLTQVLEQAQSLYRGRASTGNVENPRGPTSTNCFDALESLLAREPELFEHLGVFLQTYQKPNIDCIAVTHGPGLEPALWVGVNLARALATVWNIPLVAVNHMEGHVVMSASTTHAMSPFEFPLLSLLISGGHTELLVSKSWMQYERIGGTRDDAVGEAFDKVARLLNLPYPGGPEISRLAAEARAKGEPSSEIAFTPPMLHSHDFDFSFSGIKTEVRKFVDGKQLDDNIKMNIARAFEDAVTKVLVHKTVRAIEEYGIQTVLVGGGVSANTYIRAQLADALAKAGQIQLLLPDAVYATDNALMIALAGYFRALMNDFCDPKTLRANGNLELAQRL